MQPFQLAAQTYILVGSLYLIRTRAFRADQWPQSKQLSEKSRSQAQVRVTEQVEAGADPPETSSVQEGEGLGVSTGECEEKGFHR